MAVTEIFYVTPILSHRTIKNKFICRKITEKDADDVLTD
jgi:hypothetical protein